jgi:chromate transporter
VTSKNAEGQVSLLAIGLVFLKLGTIAFGGPAAHIAMMEDELVRGRRWITKENFLDRLGAANLIPGPSSTELAIFIGYAKQGLPGLIVAGCCFIIPAAILVSIMAAAYVRFGSLPQVAGILYGIKPVVIAIILQALWNLARTAAKSPLLILIGALAAALSYWQLNPLLVLLFAGVSSSLPLLMKMKRRPMFFLLAASGTPLVAAAVPVSLLGLFLCFLKMGATVFGSGYVLLAFLRAEFIDHLHWLTERQLIDAVAVGQFTPGPVFTTATFIGYLLAGIPGAVVATVGIFLPGFLLVAVSGPLVGKIRQLQSTSAVLDGVVIGSVAMMAVVAWQLARVSVVDWLTISILVASALLLFGFRINSALLVFAAGFLGWMGSNW